MSDSAQTISVCLGDRDYEIQIGTGNLSEVGRLIAEHSSARHAVVITDSNVQQPYGALVVSSLAQNKIDAELVAISAGEPSKSVACANDLWTRLLDLGANRQSVVVAVGGGVVGDLAGFVAATFARGLQLYQVPTTLLAQVDSSVGGKVGINLPAAKNIVGAFWQPQAVFIDTAVLTTLPLREYRAGLAEVVKYGVILDAVFFEFLESRVEQINDRNDDVLCEVIAQCCRLKADIVQQDEREETGLRSVLNYGHTFAHALEASTGYKELLHGEAVAIGMVCAGELARRLGRVDDQFTARQRKLLSQLGLPVHLPKIDAEHLLSLMRHDKKSLHGELRFVLPDRMGHVDLVDGIDQRDIVACLENA